MASEITHEELRFKNAPPTAVTVDPEKRASQSAAQKHIQCLPWQIDTLLLVLAVSLLIALVAIHFGLRTHQRCKDSEVVRQYLKNWSCIIEESDGKGQVWTCCPMGWEPFQTSCYYFSNDPMNWDDSQRNCTGMGSHLVVINTQTEQDFIFTRINGTVMGRQAKNYYIGLIDRAKKDQWHWVDSTPYNESSAFWRPGEPSNVENENCVILNVPEKPDSHGNRNWVDVPCSQEFSGICETAQLRF